MAEAPFDVARAQRWFAVEFNNLAWDIIEAGVPSAADGEQLIHTAHTSVRHWLDTGSPVDRLRGEVLLTTAYVAVSRAEPALHYARQCLALLAKLDAVEPWDRATAHAATAHAYRITGDISKARDEYEKALEAMSSISDPGEHQFFKKLYPAI